MSAGGRAALDGGELCASVDELESKLRRDVAQFCQ